MESANEMQRKYLQREENLTCPFDLKSGKAASSDAETMSKAFEELARKLESAANHHQYSS